MTGFRPPFITKSKDPPKFHEGDKVEATIMDIIYEKSTYNNQEREQYKFDLTLDAHENYPCKAWLTYYDKPGDKSHLGILILTLCEKVQKSFTTMEDFRRALIDYRKIFVRVSGFSKPKEKDDQIYPRFKIVPGHIPEYYTPSSIAEFAGPPVKPEEPKTAPSEGSQLFAAILERVPTVSPAELNDMINAEMEKSAGLLTYGPALYLVANNLNIPATARPGDTPATDEATKLSQETIGWINYHKATIGQVLDYEIYNQMKPDVRKELTDNDLLGVKDMYPFLKAEAKRYLTE